MAMGDIAGSIWVLARYREQLLTAYGSYTYVGGAGLLHIPPIKIHVRRTDFFIGCCQKGRYSTWIAAWLLLGCLLLRGSSHTDYQTGSVGWCAYGLSVTCTSGYGWLHLHRHRQQLHEQQQGSLLLHRHRLQQQQQQQQEQHCNSVRCSFFLSLVLDETDSAHAQGH